MTGYTAGKDDFISGGVLESILQILKVLHLFKFNDQFTIIQT
jgi:hypothetical protein